MQARLVDPILNLPTGRACDYRVLGDLMVPGNKLYRDNVFDYSFGFDDITGLVVRGPNTRWVDD